MKIPKDDYLRIKVIPNSPKTQLLEILEQDETKTIKIRIAAAPERGKANKELIKFLSKELKIDKSKISIISGKTQQLKLVKINEPNE